MSSFASENSSSHTESSQTQASSSSSSSGEEYRMPSHVCMQHASKIAIVQDKPIMMDYWTDSLDKNVLIGVKDNGEKILVKSEDEYTSPLSKIYKVETEYLVVSENSIYIVSGTIESSRIS
tara:strand:- start:17 stop:379 length:363 start_codon:yes stop_codon:yes gene_type:complete